jgi:maltose alpha-D-glucosyltransferase/alpha-amylase
VVFKTLADKLETLDASVRPVARRVLDGGPALVERTAQLVEDVGPLVKIRCHGDYHLGQVLWRENDFIILDFEGEPGRTLAERRAKQSPLKDVAGMLRSFDYAVYSELLSVTRNQFETFERLEPWARIWRAWTSAAFLWEYRDGAALAALVPIERDALARLLDFFMLEKIVFELRYEMNYRPDWTLIPLLGIDHLVHPA